MRSGRCVSGCRECDRPPACRPRITQACSRSLMQRGFRPRSLKSTAGPASVHFEWPKSPGSCEFRCLEVFPKRVTHPQTRPAWTSPTSWWPSCPISRVLAGLSMRQFLAVAGSCRLSFRPTSTLLWAAVDSIPTTPLRSSLGTWSIPLDDRRQSRIALIWKTDPVPFQSTSSTWPVALPRAGRGITRTLVAISAPPQMMIQGIVDGLAPAPMARLEMARSRLVCPLDRRRHYQDRSQLRP